MKLTWFSVPGASEPALVADQQLVLYRRRIGLLECLSVVHPDDDGDDDDGERGTWGGDVFAVCVCEYQCDRKVGRFVRNRGLCL